MSATTRPLIVLFVVLGLFAWVFSDAIFCDRNFTYRDAGHFYYPLLKLVADEWDAGRWPLWNPYENAGMPLLANPASAVMYPPRIVLFQWLPIPYAAAFKWYILVHVLFAAGTSYVMARHWRASEFAAGLSAISFAFGAVVMFQYCNVILLVGAAWVPLGLVATDRMLGSGDWRWSVALGVVLTMQMLGGDPEAAYVTGVLAALYLALQDVPLAAGLVAIMDVYGLMKLGAVDAVRRRLADRAELEPGRFVECVVFMACTALLTAAVSWFLFRSRRGATALADRGVMWRRRFCLGLAAVVAAGLSAVQWIPSWEFNRLSIRAAGELHFEPYAFWVAPWRLAECFWPNVTGHQFPFTTRWLDVLQVQDRVWEASLYGGVLPVLLALVTWRIRGVPHWQRWLSIVLVLCVWGAAGPAGGVSWYLRGKPCGAAVPPGAAPADADGEAAASANSGHLRTELEDPAGGLYWFLVQSLPGFGSFRYPAKLMTFAVAALAVLAAVGWDRLFTGDRQRSDHWLLGFAVATGVLAVGTCVARGRLNNWFAGSPIADQFGVFGPLQFGNSLWATLRRSASYFVESRGSVLVPDAFWCIVVAFVQTAAILVAVWGIIRWARRRERTTAAAATVLALVAFDLGLSNRWLVATADQSQFDAVPVVAQIIADAELAETAAAAEPGSTAEPFRVHRMSVWSPLGFATTVSPQRTEELHRWEKQTIQPKYGLLAGPAGRIQYTINEGTAELFDYWFFFAAFYRPTPAVLAASAPDPKQVPSRVIYFTRRGYDMWNVKYFVIPFEVIWDDDHHGTLSFLPDTRQVAASPPDATDYRVLRNLNYHPRAWIVHRLEFRLPIDDLNRLSRQTLMEEILYQGDAIWYSRAREQTKKDPREMAWVEIKPRDLDRVRRYHSPHADPSADSCRVVHYAPDRVEIDATTAARGLFILADALFPGWHATVDGQPQPVLRANRLMRGLTLEPGTHRVVFTYDPLSFRIGGALTIASIAVLVIAVIVESARKLRSRHSKANAIPR